MFGFVEQGPVLSAHKNLIAQKLADEEAEKKAKGQARKAKHLVCALLHSLAVFFFFHFTVCVELMMMSR